MFQILLVEDAVEFQKLVVRALAPHKVVCVASVDEALFAVRRSPFDLVLLDISLPKRDGYSLLGELQGDPNLAEIPVICLTGKKELTDKVTAFSLGADDYLIKPFEPLELKARVEGRLAKQARRKRSENLLRVGDLELDHGSLRASVLDGEDRRDANLTPIEFKLLRCLASRPDQVYTRDQLLVAAWGEDADVLDRVVDVHVCSLRKKIGGAGAIESVPGIGYRFAREAPSRKPKRKAA